MERLTECAILDKMLEPVTRCFTPAVAEQVAELRADPVIQARSDELAAKCNEGKLTPEEQREYGAYVEAIDLIGLMQSKARAILKRCPPGLWTLRSVNLSGNGPITVANIVSSSRSSCRFQPFTSNTSYRASMAATTTF